MLWRWHSNMFDSRGRSADSRFGVNAPRSGGRRTEPAKPFHFAITWTSLTGHLELREAVERTSATAGHLARETKQSSLGTFAGIAIPPIDRPETRSDSKARWEMVVPKMVRADHGSKALTAPITDNRNGDIYPPFSIPTWTCIDNAQRPLLSRAFAAIGRRTRSLLAGPAKTVDAVPVWPRPDSSRLALANGRASRFQVLQLSAPSSSISAENQIALPEGIEGIEDRHAARELLLSKITSTLRSHSRSVVPIEDEPGSPYRDPR